MSITFRSIALVAVAVFFFGASHSSSAQTYTESTLYSFCSQTNCTDGSGPLADLIQGSDGNFYGTTVDGGNGGGTAFRLTPAGSLTTLYAFCSQANCADGSNPYDGLVQGSDGNFYGATVYGGNDNGGNSRGNGTFFKITPSGGLTTLYSFCSQTNCADGADPDADLIQGTDGNFYGTTFGGGNDNGDDSFGSGNGTLFKLTPTGSLTTLYKFCSQADCADGTNPHGLIQGTDGNFYGTTLYGGNYNGSSPSGAGNGTVFQITPSGSLTTLYRFCSEGGTGCTDGAQPQAGLSQGADGSFYGTTTNGGNTDDNGTIFKITPAGIPTTLYTFCSQSGCPDGFEPNPHLVQGTDGNFYGTTGLGGNHNNNDSAGNGTAFKFTPSGSLTTLYRFCSQTNCADGSIPNAGLVQGADGNLYGTSRGGAKGNGTVYELSIVPALQPPVQLSVSPSSVSAGASFTLTYTVTNATSDTLQYCFATNNAGNTKWIGVKTGKTTPQSASLTAPSANGTYTYSLTCGGVESGFATLTVTGGKNSTDAGLAATPNPATVGQKVTLTATVTHNAGSAPLKGTVSFGVDGEAIGSGEVNSSGVATLSASTNGIAPGNYPVIATYSGDANYNPSTSPAYTVTLDKALTSITVTASPNPLTPPAKCTLKTTVKRTASGATGFATGSVTFSVGTTVIGTAKLNPSGTATLSASTSGIAAGNYPVTAKYNGDASDVASSSPAVTVTVQ